MHFLVSNCGIGNIHKIQTMVEYIEDTVIDTGKGLYDAKNTTYTAANKAKKSKIMQKQK